MKHIIKISQPDYVGSTIIAFEDEGKARLAVDAITASGDDRTTAEYLGQGSLLHVTFMAKMRGAPESLRTQAMEAYERGLPHRQAFDVLDLQPTGAIEGEFQCYVLGGIRPKKPNVVAMGR